MNSAVLRELGAEVRTFKTVRGAMLWLSEERNRRGRLQQPYEFGSSQRSLEARNVCNATYAALVRCMNPAGLPFVWLLPEWHRGWTPRKELAFDAGLTEWSLRGRCITRKRSFGSA
jgi:hypothetical protein